MAQWDEVVVQIPPAFLDEKAGDAPAPEGDTSLGETNHVNIERYDRGTAFHQGQRETW